MRTRVRLPPGPPLSGGKMLDKLKKLFGIKKQSIDKPKSSAPDYSVYNDHDIIDYDGMGNQGRFPKKSK